MQNKGYSPDFIDRVRDANNIVDVAKAYLPLKQKGQDFWACCPFHTEKTASFKVSSSTQSFYCFGCHTSGNVFSLLMKMENLAFPEAVEHLARKANIELPKTAESAAWLKAREHKEKIYHALMLARDFYCQNLYLPKNRAALDYLHQRGIEDEYIKLFHIGYSDSWGGVIDALKRQGVTEQIMKQAGIAATNEQGHVWDAQFERITFSIHDVYGNCIGFTGRTMKNDENLAKYKNTAETLVFNKSNIVYGVDVMKQKTRGKRIAGVIVVEGNVDEIAMVKHGFANTVACMGTALTKFHAGVLARFGRTVYLCLDGDNAGQKATLKSIDVLQESGLTVRIVALPDRQDPDEFLRAQGATAMQKMLDNSLGGVEFKLQYAKEHCDMSNRTGKAEYFNQALGILSQVQSSDREFYFKEVADTLGILVEAVSNNLDTYLKKIASKPEESQKNNKNTISGGSSEQNNHNMPKGKHGAVLEAEKIVTAAVLHNRPYAQLNLDDLPEFSDPVYQKVVSAGLKLNQINDKLSPEEVQHLDPLIAKRFDGAEQEQIDEWHDCLRRLQVRKLELRKQELQRAEVKDLAEIMRLTKQINALNQKQKMEDK